MATYWVDENGTGSGLSSSTPIKYEQLLLLNFSNSLPPTGNFQNGDIVYFKSPQDHNINITNSSALSVFQIPGPLTISFLKWPGDSGTPTITYNRIDTGQNAAYPIRILSGLSGNQNRFYSNFVNYRVNNFETVSNRAFNFNFNQSGNALSSTNIYNGILSVNSQVGAGNSAASIQSTARSTVLKSKLWNINPPVLTTRITFGTLDSLYDNEIYLETSDISGLSTLFTSAGTMVNNKIRLHFPNTVSASPNTPNGLSPNTLLFRNNTLLLTGNYASPVSSDVFTYLFKYDNTIINDNIIIDRIQNGSFIASGRFGFNRPVGSLPQASITTMGNNVVLGIGYFDFNNIPPSVFGNNINLPFDLWETDDLFESIDFISPNFLDLKRTPLIEETFYRKGSNYSTIGAFQPDWSESPVAPVFPAVDKVSEDAGQYGPTGTEFTPTLPLNKQAPSVGGSYLGEESNDEITPDILKEGEVKQNLGNEITGEYNNRPPENKIAPSEGGSYLGEESNDVLDPANLKKDVEQLNLGETVIGTYELGIIDFPPENKVEDQYPYDNGNKIGSLGRIDTFNSNISEILLNNLESLINNELTEYKPLPYQVDRDKNSKRDINKRYSILMSNAVETDLYTCEDVMDRSFEIVLSMDFVNVQGSGDKPMRNVANILSNDHELLRRKIKETNAGLYSANYVLSEWEYSLSEPTYNEDNKMVEITASINIKIIHRYHQ